MLAFIIVLALTGFGAVGLLTWRWMGVVERVRVERERAGGAALAVTVKQLADTVAGLEAYLTGTDYKQIPQ